MLLQISHTTEYNYDQPVEYALQQVRLTPQVLDCQKTLDWKITVKGGMIEASYIDHHGNTVHLINVDAGGQSITITAAGSVETTDTAGIIPLPKSGPPLWYFSQQTPLTAAGDAITELAAESESHENILNRLHALSRMIAERVRYGKDGTYVVTTAEEAMQGGTGVCQDHAHIFIAAARAGGIPARYVSGYLMLTGQIDQEASHAWAEAYVEGLGWVGFDVSNAQSPDERYVRLAVGRDYHDAAPFSGMRVGSAAETMIVNLQVQQ
jgi:transglutaminase-like putative cysteine protease